MATLACVVVALACGVCVLWLELVGVRMAHAAAAAGRGTAAHATTPRTAAASTGAGSATAMRGLALFRDGRVADAMPLLQAAIDADPLDWVSLEHAAGAYAAAARKAAAAASASRHARMLEGVAPALGTEERQLLEAAAALFCRGVEARGQRREQQQQRRRQQASDPDATAAVEVTGTAAVSVGGGEGGSVDAYYSYPQQEFAQPLALALRGWGDALAWLGRPRQATAVFQRGVDAGLWHSPLCRPTPRAAPTRHMPYRFVFPPAAAERAFPHVVPALVAALPAIRAELEASLRRAGASASAWRTEGWEVEEAGLHSTSSWHVVPLAVNGQLRARACRLWPRTCRAIAAIPALAVHDGQVKVSMMQPGTVVRPHAGPTNTRLRVHCTLMMPTLGSGVADAQGVPASAPAATLRVGTANVTWEAGRCLVFDESCEHAVVVSPDASSMRVVLIADMANPFLATPGAYVRATRHSDASAGRFGHPSRRAAAREHKQLRKASLPARTKH